ncbi:MAG TPA: hypothetical protein VGI31_03075 [Streptosporangiaceae bacterium]|jgi:hypothetical protein
MNRADLTALYLDEVKRQGVAARDLIGSQADSDVLHAFYSGLYLSRPLFLGHEEVTRLYSDLDNVRSALVSLPGRLFGGDLAAFARAVGMTEIQVSAIMRCPSTTVTKMSRADLYLDETGFKLLELNMGSALGGIDNAEMISSLLEHPVLAEFAETHRLTYVDTLREQANTINAECGLEPGSRPMMAAVEWPSSYKSTEPFMRLHMARLRKLGYDAHCCHIGQLEVHDERVWLEGRPVDVINRVFLIEDLMESPEAPALAEPILDAVARGWVKIFTPMDSGLYSSKGALAMLSDEENRSLLDPNELASLDRLLPWTRMARPGPVTLEDGRRVDLLQYALDHQDDLALKPTAMHGGIGIVLGWSENTNVRAWEEQVRAAMDGPYVLQRRIRPVAELFPGDDGELVPWIVTWGPFTVASGYGGMYARAMTVASNAEVINTNHGAYVGSGLYALPDAG